MPLVSPHKGDFKKEKKIDLPHPLFAPPKKCVPVHKITKNGSLLRVTSCHIPLESPWKGDFKNQKKCLTRPTHFLTHPKLAAKPKYEQKWVVIKYGHIIYHRKPIDRRLQKDQKYLTRSTHFLPHPKIRSLK